MGDSTDMKALRQDVVKHTRFSDAQLTKLRQEFDYHKEEEERRWETIVTMVEKNTHATENLAVSVKAIAESTDGVVSLYRDIEGVARVGSGVKKGLTYLAGLGAIGTMIAAGIVYILDKLSHLPG